MIVNCRGERTAYIYNTRVEYIYIYQISDISLLFFPLFFLYPFLPVPSPTWPLSAPHFPLIGSGCSPLLSACFPYLFTSSHLLLHRSFFFPFPDWFSSHPPFPIFSTLLHRLSTHHILPNSTHFILPKGVISPGEWGFIVVWWSDPMHPILFHLIPSAWHFGNFSPVPILFGPNQSVVSDVTIHLFSGE